MTTQQQQTKTTTPTNGTQPHSSPSKTGNFLIDEGATDEGNAQCMVKLYPNTFLNCPEFGKNGGAGWLYYNGKYWQSEHAEEILDRHVVRMLKKRSEAAFGRGVDNNGNWIEGGLIRFCVAGAHRLKGCKTLLQSLVTVSINEFDNDKDLLNCNNAVVNLKTSQTEKHSPIQRFTYCIPVDYNSNADYSDWVAWLREVTGDDLETVKFMQQAAGYSLSGRTQEECLFYIFGPTRSGKGTFSETILKLLGHPLSDGVDFATFTAKRDHDSQNFDLAGLKATRLIVASESNKYQVLNPRRIKSVTGGDAIRCAHKHGKFFSYFPQFKIWLFSNEPVTADSEDDAIWGRVNVIEFPNSYLGKEDKSLKQKMLSQANLEGVLNWAIKGAQEWYASLPNGLQKPQKVINQTKEHRQKNDISMKFITECIKPDQGAFLPNAVWKTVYKSWCEVNGYPYKVGKIAPRLHALYSAGTVWMKTSDIEAYAYDTVIKFDKTKYAMKQFKGFHGIMIPEHILDEYL